MSVSGAPPSGFQVRYADGRDGDSRLLGLWEPVSTTPLVTEFGLHDGTVDAVGSAADVPEWCVSVPSEAGRADAMLSDSEAILGASQAALPVALERIGQFGHEAALLTSFGTVGRPAVHIEARLVELLGEFGAGVAPDGDGQLSSVWRRLIADLHAFLGRLTMALAPYSLVRTYAGDRCIGVSAIHGPGRLATVRSAESGAVAARHARAVSVVLASQTTLVRTFAVAVRGAAIVTTALTMPLGALLALPAAWHLIQAVQTEARMRKRPLD